MKIRTQTSSHSGQTRRLVDGISAPIRSCWTDFSYQGSSPFDQIDQSQHGESPVGVLRQTTVPDLGKAPQALEGQKRVLNLGTDTGLSPVRFHVCLRQRTVAVSPLVGEVLRPWGKLPESFPLSLATVGAISVEPGFLPMQQFEDFMAVMDIGGSHARAMDQTGLAVRPDMHLHPVQKRIQKVPLIALLDLMHVQDHASSLRS